MRLRISIDNTYYFISAWTKSGPRDFNTFQMPLFTGLRIYSQIRIFSRTLPKMVSKSCKYMTSGFFYAIENCVSSCLSALPRVFERMARLRIDSWHGNVLFQGGACTAGDLVERTESNEMVWVSHTFFCFVR